MNSEQRAKWKEFRAEREERLWEAFVTEYKEQKWENHVAESATYNKKLNDMKLESENLTLLSLWACIPVVFALLLIQVIAYFNEEMASSLLPGVICCASAAIILCALTYLRKLVLDRSITKTVRDHVQGRVRWNEKAMTPKRDL